MQVRTSIFAQPMAQWCVVVVAVMAQWCVVHVYSLACICVYVCAYMYNKCILF